MISLAWISMSAGALEAARDLVDEDLRVRKRHPLALRAPTEQQRPMLIATPTQIVCTSDFYVLHRVVHGEARIHGAAGGVDVHADVLVGVLGLEVDQLGDDEVGDVLGDRRAQEDDPLVEQAGVDVERPAHRGRSARRPWEPEGSSGTPV